MPDPPAGPVRPYLGAYWPARTMTRQEGAAAIVSFLQGAAALDPAFEALRRSIALTPAAVDREVRAVRTDAAPRIPIEDLGLRWSAWDGGATGDDLSVSVAFGGTSAVVPNSVVASAVASRRPAALR